MYHQNIPVTGNTVGESLVGSLLHRNAVGVVMALSREGFGDVGVRVHQRAGAHKGLPYADIRVFPSLGTGELIYG